MIGGDSSDWLIGGGSTDRGENHFDGGAGDDVLIAGGTKTQFLEALLTPDFTNAILSNPIWGIVTGHRQQWRWRSQHF